MRARIEVGLLAIGDEFFWRGDAYKIVTIHRRDEHMECDMVAGKDKVFLEFTSVVTWYRDKPLRAAVR